MKKIVIGQAGGPTAVINATLAALTEELKESCELIFLQEGYAGLKFGRFIEGNTEVYKWLSKNRDVPGSCLGSGRFSLTDDDVNECVYNLKKIKADALVLIGGNGTMAALRKIEKASEQLGYQIQVIGLAKTVDNDLGGTDHSPGFASAAKYIATSTLDMSRDLYSMRNFEQVRILETMGRNTGWLAAASGLFKRYEEDGPHFIAVPEEKLNEENLLNTVEKAIKQFGCALIVVSEGVEWEEGTKINRKIVKGRPVLGGISREIETLVQEELGVFARSELLGMNQRSSSIYVSSVDREEASNIGKAGAEWIQEGKSGVMSSIQRSNEVSYNVNIIPVELKHVASIGERKLPDEFVKNLNVYYEWLEPLIGDGIFQYPPPAPRSEYHVRE